jgi:hypothetical protein
MHRHSFIGLTTLDAGHNHIFSGMTSEAPDTAGHIHSMRGTTTIDDGHAHRYDLTTAPGVEYGNGHLHPFEARTGVAYIPVTHRHAIYGNTSVTPKET